MENKKCILKRKKCVDLVGGIKEQRRERRSKGLGFINGPCYPAVLYYVVLSVRVMVFLFVAGICAVCLRRHFISSTGTRLAEDGECRVSIFTPRGKGKGIMAAERAWDEVVGGREGWLFLAFIPWSLRSLPLRPLSVELNYP